MATPILLDLRKAFPQAEITAMCLSSVCDLLHHEKSIDELFCFHRPKNTFQRRMAGRDIISTLRGGKYDLGILLTNSFSSAWWFWQGHVKKRLGYAQHCRSWLLTDPIPVPRAPLHQVEVYKELLRPLGIEPSTTLPHISLTDEELSETHKLLAKLGYRKNMFLIGINPGAAYGSAKCWPLDRFCALTQRLLADPDVLILFFGDDSSSAIVKEICQGISSRVVNLAGDTTLRELACLIHLVDLLITNDSGPMHIAAAFNTPLIALFGSTDPKRTGPYGHTEEVVQGKASCSPCFRRTCPIDRLCMRQISVEQVANLAFFHKNNPKNNSR